MKIKSCDFNVLRRADAGKNVLDIKKRMPPTQLKIILMKKTKLYDDILFPLTNSSDMFIQICICSIRGVKHSFCLMLSFLMYHGRHQQ